MPDTIQNSREMALEELKLLSTIISKQEEFRLTARGWSLALLTGLVVAQLSEGLSLDRVAFLLLALAIIGSSWIIEAWYAMAQLGALDRSFTVEQFLQASDGVDYDGPKITTELGPTSRNSVLTYIRRAVLYGRISLPNLVLAAVVLVVAFAVNPQ